MRVRQIERRGVRLTERRVLRKPRALQRQLGLAAANTFVDRFVDVILQRHHHRPPRLRWRGVKTNPLT